MDAFVEAEASSFHSPSIHQGRHRLAIPTMRSSSTPVLRHSFLDVGKKEVTALCNITNVHCRSPTAKTNYYDFVLIAEEARKMRTRPLWPLGRAEKVDTQTSSRGHPKGRKVRSILMVAKARHWEVVKRKNKTIYILEITFDATKIALPFADMPIIRRNQEIRKWIVSGHGKRRSILSMTRHLLSNDADPRHCSYNSLNDRSRDARAAATDIRSLDFIRCETAGVCIRAPTLSAVGDAS